VKHPYDDNWENRSNPHGFIPKSYSLPRSLVADVRARAKALALSDSAYVCAVLRADLAKGMDSPLLIEVQKSAGPATSTQQSPPGVVVEFFD
jgi:hypothetical protein